MPEQYLNASVDPSADHMAPTSLACDACIPKSRRCCCRPLQQPTLPQQKHAGVCWQAQHAIHAGSHACAARPWPSTFAMVAVVAGHLTCTCRSKCLGPDCRYNMTLVPSRSSLCTMQDVHSKPVTTHGYFPGVEGSIPPLVDIPPYVMSAHLYGDTDAA